MKVGTKPVLDEPFQDMAAIMFMRGWDTMDIALYLGVNEASVYNYLAILKKQL